MIKEENKEKTVPVTASAGGEEQVSRELEDEIYEKRVLSKLDCIEKLNNGRNKDNFFIVHPNHGMLYQYTQLGKALERKFNVYGIQARGLLPQGKMPESPDQMVNDYIEQILKVQKTGTYFISGFCGGNAVAYEIARRLEQRELEVGTVVLIDSHVFVTDRVYKTLRYVQHYPKFMKKNLLIREMDVFKREMHNNRFVLSDNDDGGFRKKKVEKYMDTLCTRIFYLGFVNAPLLVPHAILSPRPVATQERFDRLTRSTATLIKIPGTHDGILEQPDVQKLAEVIIENT